MQISQLQPKMQQTSRKNVALNSEGSSRQSLPKMKPVGSNNDDSLPGRNESQELSELQEQMKPSTLSRKSHI